MRRAASNGDIIDPALAEFTAALADADNNPVDILTIGTSISEGGSVTAYTDRWLDLLVASLRSTHQPAGVTGGRGYVPAFYAVSTLTDPFTYSGGTDTGNRGLGHRARSMSANANTMSITVTCTSFHLFYVTAPTLGEFEVIIDGGSPTTIDSYSASAVNGVKWSSGALGAGSHTVVISPNSLNESCIIEGIMVYNGDETKGIRAWDAAKGGSNSSTFGGPTDNWKGAVASVNPDLTIIEMGVNEWWAGSLTAAQFETNMGNIVTDVRSQAPNTSIMFVILYERGGTGFSGSETWDDFADAMQSLADSDGDIAVLDLRGFEDTPGRLAGDVVHLTNAGAIAFRDEVLAFVT